MNLKYLSFIYCFILLSLISKAQEFSNEFGTITQTELYMTDYEKDENAEAVIIYDIGESSFYNIENTFKLRYKRRTKIKVLKESYIEDADFYIPIYEGKGNKDELIELEAFTYNIENEKIVKTELDEVNIFKEQVFNDRYKIKFTMPNLKEGSVVEIRYEIISPRIFFLRDWRFQNFIHTIYSECKVNMIPFLNYMALLRGADNFDEYNSYIDSKFKECFHNAADYRETIFQYIMRDIPAFKDESFITSYDDYIIKLDFQLKESYPLDFAGKYEILSTWFKLLELLNKSQYFGQYINKSKSNFKKLIKQKEINIADQNAQANYIIDYLKNNYTREYDNFNCDKTLKEFLKDKIGSSAEINLYLAGALKAFDIETYTVILSTRKNGKIIKEFPFLDPFDYVLAYAKIDNQWVLLDATDEFCPNNMIPIKCFNDIGLIVNKGSPKWIKISHNKMSVIQTNINSELSQDLTEISGAFSCMASGYFAMDFRKSYKNDPKKLEKKLIKKGIELSDTITTENYDNIDKNYSINYSASQYTEKIGNKIFINPFFNLPYDDNPFKAELRNYPVDMIFPQTVSYINEITIPADCMIEKLPENFFTNSPLFTLNYNIIETEGKIKVSASYVFKKGIYDAKYFIEIKQYFNLIIKHLNQKIVLIKR